MDQKEYLEELVKQRWTNKDDEELNHLNNRLNKHIDRLGDLRNGLNPLMISFAEYIFELLLVDAVSMAIKAINDDDNMRYPFIMYKYNVIKGVLRAFKEIIYEGKPIPNRLVYIEECLKPILEVAATIDK